MVLIGVDRSGFKVPGSEDAVRAKVLRAEVQTKHCVGLLLA